MAPDGELNERWSAVYCDGCGYVGSIYECDECMGVYYCESCIPDHEKIDHADDASDGDSKEDDGEEASSATHPVADYDALRRWREAAKGWVP